MSEPKTRSLGIIGVNKFAKHAEWKAYTEATAKFQDAKANLNVTKNKVREMLRKHSPALLQIENLEFTVASNRKEIAVFEKLQTAASAHRGENKELDFD